MLFEFLEIKMKKVLLNSINFKFFANRSLIALPKRHYSVCILCKNSLLYEKNSVLASKVTKCE